MQKPRKIRKIYKFNNILFEDSDAGPWPLKEDLTPMEKCPKKFTIDIEKWLLFNKTDQERYRINE